MLKQILKLSLVIGLLLSIDAVRFAYADVIANYLTVEINDSGNHLDAEDIRVAGTLNGWTATQYPTEQKKSGAYSLTLPLPDIEGVSLFNIYHTGNWQNPIATEFGKPSTCGFLVDNRSNQLKIDFYGWSQDNHIKQNTNTLVGNLDTYSDFPMPQLDRKGEFYVLLPASYEKEAVRRYPVIYMLDGQNLFTEANSYSYEWRVDEIVKELGLEVIVVGVANGENRWQEYNPWDTVNYTGAELKGLGKQTIAFIKASLKPFIDEQFRTLTSSQDTALIGSSLGGLMALYAGTEHADTFGKVAAFSPSFSFKSIEGQNKLDSEDSNLFAAISALKAAPTSKIYFDMGEVEYGSFALVDSLHKTLIDAGMSETQLKLVKDKRGRHCELDWSKRLPMALTWLLAE
ncbi:MAG: hypothetical protein GJ680_20360 [Alteromonadaceae bacterium]|nr:hypothetical protein [Alteromonadaceae bacterium]